MNMAKPILFIFLPLLLWTACGTSEHPTSNSGNDLDSFPEAYRQYVFINNEQYDSVEINLVKNIKAEDIQWCYDNFYDAEMKYQEIGVQMKVVLN